MLKSGFWAPRWSDSTNIWCPIGYYRESNPATHPLPEHPNSAPSQQYPTPPHHLVATYITGYMQEMWSVQVKDYARYVHAMTHKSHKPENGVGMNNERLEFLGDSVLQIVMTEYLYHRFQQKSEGFLTKVRMKLINGSTLSEIGYKLQLQKMLRVSPRLLNINKKLIEDAFEAIICVIYQEHGLAYVSRVLISLYEQHINFENIVIDSNYKELLLKHVQKLPVDKVNTLEYRIIDSVGPSHSKLFRIQVVYDGKMLGVGMGTTRRAGEQAAARETLIILGAHQNTLIDS